MKQLLLTFLTVGMMGGPWSQTNAQIYEAVSMEGSETSTHFDSNVTSIPPFYSYNKYDRYVELTTFWQELSIPVKDVYLEWGEFSDTVKYPKSCNLLPEDIAGPGRVSINSYFYTGGDGKILLGTTRNTTQSLELVTNNGRREPYNVTAQRSGKVVRLPRYIDCDPADGDVIVATGDGYLNAQKWWDGGTPNSRTSSYKYSVTYRAAPTIISAAFTPDILQLTGSVKEYITTNSVLMIATKGGTRIEIAWGDVNNLQYERDGTWTGGHRQVVSVTDGATKVVKLIRVRGEVAGPTLFSVPVTVTIS